MGIVYEAYDRVRKKRVALKKLRNACADSVFRFKREFRTLRDISHPNIITLYELVAEQGQFCLTMEVVDGVDLLVGLRGERLAHDRPDTASQSTAVSASCGITDTGPTTPISVPQRALPRGLPSPPVERPSLTDSVDLDHLLSALRQLAQALHVLHAAGTIHRDLKPSNVLLTRTGRVVLMDFGIASAAAPDGRHDEPGMRMGTPAFMAPEQIRGEPVTAATDWYAFGILMYAILSGTLPFVGDENAVLQAKQQFAPLAPSEFARDIPLWLEQLCLELIVHEPGDRPTGAAILERLGIDERASEPLIGANRSTWTEEVFVGRTEELRRLSTALAKTRAGSSRCVLIRGPLGIGKSALLDRFAGELRAHERATLVLTGRCHERESLHYKALDSIIDQLSGYLACLPEDRIDALLYPPPSALMQVFPVLRRVQRWSEAPAPSGSPHTIRQQAVHSIRALLAKLAEERPVVLCIDDLHWAGGDSMELLLDMLFTPAPAGLLVVATVCSDACADDARLGHYLASIESLPACSRLQLGPLSEREQEELSKALSEHFGHECQVLDEVHERAWKESAGHPMLLVEIARHAAMSATRPISDQSAGVSLNLEDIIRERVDCLPENEKRLVQLIAVAGEPMPMRLLAHIGTLSLAEVERAAAFLRINHLVRVSRSDDEPWLDTYHQKVRSAVVDHLPEWRVPGLHAELARALERWRKPRPALMARHWLLAGNLERAARYLMSAATDATDSLAFEHAAKLYARARDLEPALAGDHAFTRDVTEDGEDEPSAEDPSATTDVRFAPIGVDA